MKEKLLLASSKESKRIYTKDNRTTVYENLESELYNWVKEELGKGNRLTTVLIRQKALALANEPVYNYTEFKASENWVKRFKERHNIDIEDGRSIREYLLLRDEVTGKFIKKELKKD